MATLYYFLKERGVDVSLLDKLEEDKVDESVVTLMSDSDLAKYIPKYGDRIATMSWARRNLDADDTAIARPETRKRALMTRLRERMEKKRHVSGGGTGEVLSGRLTSLIGNINARKKERRVELGWVDFDQNKNTYKQVKARTGGGTRQLKVPVDCTSADLLEEAIKLFFPGGNSHRGNISEYQYHLSDFSNREVSTNKKIEELYDESKIKLMRLYLATKRKDDPTEDDVTGGSVAQKIMHVTTHPGNSKPLERGNRRPLDTKNSRPMYVENSNPLDIEDSNPLDIENSKPLDIENSKLLDTVNSKPLDTVNSRPLYIENNKPLDTKNSRPLDIANSKPLDIENSKLLDTENSRPLDIENSKPLDIENSKLFDTKNSRPLDIENSKPLDIENSKLLDTENSRPLYIEKSRPLNTEKSMPMEIENSGSFENASNDILINTEDYHTMKNTATSTSTVSTEQILDINQLTNLIVFDTANLTEDIGNYDLDDSGVVSFPLLNMDSDSTLNDANIFRVKLHRGHVLTEFMEFFITNSELDVKRNLIEIEMILPNGMKEAGEDNGGILRDALSEFWETFYDTTTIGRNVKVPALNHAMTADHWRACAQIVLLGYKQEGYFPIQFAMPFLLSVFNGPDATTYNTQELISSFMEFIPSMEKDLFQDAMNDINSVDYDELLDFMDAHEVRKRPTQDNITTIIEQVAHKELVQTPAYVAECWGSTFRVGLQSIMKSDVRTICSELIPTARRVLNILEFPSELTSNDRETIGFLKRFVKGLSDKTLRAFLRFVTGSDLLIATKITIRLVEADSDFTRRPIAHTCGKVLDLPKVYESFLQFRKEFDSVLASNVWVMDIV